MSFGNNNLQRIRVPGSSRNNLALIGSTTTPINTTRVDYSNDPIDILGLEIGYQRFVSGHLGQF